MMRVEEISLKDINRMSLEELAALRWFLVDSTEENWNLFILERLRAEMRRLVSQNIPPNQWPKQFQGDDWEDRIKKKFGLKTKEEDKEKIG